MVSSNLVTLLSHSLVTKFKKFYWQCPWGLCQKELGEKRLVDFGVIGSYWAMENVLSIWKFEFEYMKHDLFGIIKSGHTFGPSVSYKVKNVLLSMPLRSLSKRTRGKRLVDFGVIGSYWAMENVLSIWKFEFEYMKYEFFAFFSPLPEVTGFEPSILGLLDDCSTICTLLTLWNVLNTLKHLSEDMFLAPWHSV